jgi:hypothetical protein
MTSRTGSNSDPSTPRRRRPPRPLSLLPTVTDDLTAEAMDDARAAQKLIDDLLALAEAGLIAPVESEGDIRYAPTDPDRLADLDDDPAA